MIKQDVFIQICLDIQKRDGLVTPESIVDEATPISSPIHDMFEWDDDKAGYEYRLWQARKAIKQVKVIIDKKVVNNFESVIVATEKGSKRGYVTTVEIMKHKDLKEQVLAKALANLEYWYESYGNYSELFGLVDKNLLQKLRKKYG